MFSIGQVAWLMFFAGSTSFVLGYCWNMMPPDFEEEFCGCDGMATVHKPGQDGFICAPPAPDQASK